MFCHSFIIQTFDKRNIRYILELIPANIEERRDMATSDIRFKRMDKEYLSLRETQSEVYSTKSTDSRVPSWD